MPDIPARLLNGGFHIKFLPDGKISVCVNVADASADPKLAPLGDICSPPIDVKELAIQAGVIAEGAFTRFTHWLSKKVK